MKRFYHIGRTLLLSGAVCLLSLPLQGQTGESGCTAAGCHDALMQHAFQHEAAEDCESCHEPGDGDHPASEGREFEFSGEVPGLCYDCHDEYNSGKSVHSPVEDGDCLACHDPHASSKAGLLTEAFPAGLYAEGAVDGYALCFDCHDSDLFDAENTREATAFRDDRQNLHYVHLKREKSRSCIHCHDLHGSDQPHLLLESSTFGQWKMPLNFRVAKNGGSCRPGCHEAKTYSR